MVVLAVCTVGAALTVTCAVLLAYNFYTLRTSTVEQLQSQAQMLAFNSSAVLSFQDESAAEDLMASLKRLPSVEMAYLVDAENHVLASYPPNIRFNYAQYEDVVEHKFTNDRHLLIREPITADNDQIGELILRANLDNFYVGIRHYLLIVASVMIFAMGISVFLSLRLQRTISAPIVKLVEVARAVAEQQDYSARVEWKSEDELGRLCETFDHMLDEIQHTKDEVQATNNDLDARVHRRTSQLTAEVESRKRVLIELKTAMKAAEASSKAKSEFVANMSHEIRTPLNGVLGFTELLMLRLDDGDTEECHDFLDTIEASGRHLAILLNDILDISKIEAGKLEVERVPCSPHEILTHVVNLLRVQAREKGLELQYRWASQTPKMIHTDPARLRQVIMNLVGNAVKFTEQGFVCITARFDEQHRTLAVSVEDTGVGISEEKQQNIFLPFVQADTTVTRRFGGTGLGLTISRRLAVAMGGELSVTSEEGCGSCFTATFTTGEFEGLTNLSSTFLDAAAPTNSGSGDRRSGDSDQKNCNIVAPHEASGKKTGGRLAAANILVVEDGPTNRKLITVILEQAGATVVVAENGQIGLDLGRDGSFDLILMDMQMPVMDGYTSTTKLREAGITVPIVALTAHAMSGAREECLTAGCSDYMTKPIVPAKLLDLVASQVFDAPEEVASKTDEIVA